jgi:hypothetical protein
VARPITPPISTAEIADAAVTTDKIADGAVTVAELATNAVETAKIANQAVTGDKIQDASITPVKLAFAVPSRPMTPPIETAEIGDAQVTPVKLSFAVPTRPLVPPIAAAEIADLQITDSKIADGAVTGGKVADGAIGVTKLQGLSVTTDKLAPGAVTPEKVDSVNTPTDGQLLSIELATSRYKYVTPAVGASGITFLNSNIMVFSNSDSADVDQALDLSAWIPTTATGVLVEMQHTGATSDGEDRILLVFGRRTAMDWGYSTLPLQGRYQDLYKGDIVATDSARMIRVFISRSGRFSAVNVWIKGYIE